MNNTGKLILVIVALLVTSCVPGGSSGPPDIAPVIKGTQGIAIGFIPGAPQPTLYEDSPFVIQVWQHNRGVHNVPFTEEINGKPFNSGPAIMSINVDPFYIEGEPDEETKSEFAIRSNEGRPVLLGKKRMPLGEEWVVAIDDYKVRPVLGERESPETQIYYSICYPYKTELTTEVCVDSSRQNRNLRTQACEARDLAFSGGQGAPVAVTGIEVDMIPVGSEGFMTKPNFVIHLANVGEGTVIRALDLENPEKNSCEDQTDEQAAFNTVTVLAELSGIPLDCNPKNLKLTGEVGKLFCTLSYESLVENNHIFARQDNFVSTLTVSAYYLYSRSKSKTVEIQRTFINDETQDLLKQFEEDKCLPWQDRKDGVCVDKCGTSFPDNENKPSYSCTCDTFLCEDVRKKDIDRCFFKQPDPVCGSTKFCCIPKICSDFDDRDACLDESDKLDCNWCLTKKKCMAPKECTTTSCPPNKEYTEEVGTCQVYLDDSVE